MRAMQVMDLMVTRLAERDRWLQASSGGAAPNDVLRPSTADAPAPATADDPFDPEWSREMVRRVLGPVIDSYFRARVVGAERIPKGGPLILAANHSGNAFPYDGMVLDALLWEHDGLRPDAKLRTVYEHELSLTWWMRPFGLANFWRRGGGVDMTFDNFDRLLARGDRVLYFPEGVPGIGKGFNRRYQLQRFRTSFLLLAARHGAPVLPVHIVNGEWLHPFGYTFRWLDRVFQRLFRVPFLPLPLGILAIVFPWIWYLAFPARLVFAVGTPIDARALLREEGVADLDHPPRELLQRAAERVRARMQRELDACVAEHGQARYGPRSLLGALRAARGRLARVLPTGWPVAFIRQERDRARPPARSRLHAVLRDLDLAAFYLPFGWPLLTLARRLRRPPYGYRGLTRQQQDVAEGQYLWRLSERPLPSRD